MEKLFAVRCVQVKCRNPYFLESAVRYFLYEMGEVFPLTTSTIREVVTRAVESVDASASLPGRWFNGGPAMDVKQMMGPVILDTLELSSQDIPFGDRLNLLFIYHFACCPPSSDEIAGRVRYSPFHFPGFSTEEMFLIRRLIGVLDYYLGGSKHRFALASSLRREDIETLVELTR